LIAVADRKGVATDLDAALPKSLLCVTALLEPQTYAQSPIVYPPGFERLSQQQIADIISEETGRDVRYQYITPDEWTRQLKAAAVHSGGLVNDAMIQHLPTHARTFEDNTTIARMDTDPWALAAASGRPPDIPKLRPPTPLGIRRRHRRRMSDTVELLP
jgi:hypothetical protein